MPWQTEFQEREDQAQFLLGAGAVLASGMAPSIYLPINESKQAGGGKPVAQINFGRMKKLLLETIRVVYGHDEK